MRFRSFFFCLPMTLVLLLIWLLLATEISVAQFLLGLGVSFTIVLISARMRPDMAYPRRMLLLVKLLFVSIRDIIQSNIEVGLLILQWRRQDYHSGYIHIPLSIRDPHALALLACYVTFTPGTVWSGMSEKDYILRLHVLNLQDESIWYEIVKVRYEKLLLEVFE